MKIRRIVVGLEVAPHSRPALAMAASIAGIFDAQLEALFVENDELRRLAGLPFAREMGFSSASLRRIDPAAMERAMRAQANEVRRALGEIAGRSELRWSFRVARGCVTDALLAASPAADLTVVSIGRWDPETLRLARGTTNTLLVIPRGASVGGPLAALCSSTVPPSRAVPLLCSLARAIGDGLSILAVGGGEAGAARWCEEAAGLLKARGRSAVLRCVPAASRDALAAALEELAPRALALVGAEAVLGEEGLAQLLRSARRAVFVSPG